MANARRQLGELADIALRLLPQMYDERSRLFSHKTELRDGRLVNRGINRYYSAASLVGALSQRIVPADELLPVGRILDALEEAVQGARDWPLLGTALWAGALAEDARFAPLVRVMDEQLSPRGAGSAGLAQALQGLVAGGEAFPSERDRAARLAARCAAELEGRHSPAAGVFRAQPFPPTGVRTLVAYRITSFASQVYPLLALSSFARWREARPPSLLGQVADRLVRAQGKQGQWWWLYAPGAEAVLEHYPVYSVHQDGMAFMGLVPVERLGEGSYAEPLSRGVDWILGENELGASLAQQDPPFICRNIQRRGSDADEQFGISRANLGRVVARSVRSRPDPDAAPGPVALEPLHECRSYHLGWLLYAHSLIAE